MTKKILIHSLFFLLGGIIIGFWVKSLSNENPITTETTTIITDTVWAKPDTVFISDTVVRYDTVKLTEYNTLTVIDSTYVILPIEQTLFRYPEQADIYVSGYKARIDSAIFFVNHTETVRIEKEKPNVLQAEIGTGILFLEGDCYQVSDLNIGLKFNKIKLSGGVGVSFGGTSCSMFYSAGISYVIR